MTTANSPIDPTQASSELERTNRLYAMLSHINRTIVRTDDAQELYSASCRIATEYGGFVCAWVGLLEPGGKGATPVAASGAVSLAQLKSIAGIADFHEPTVQATRNAGAFVVSDTLDDPQAISWRDLTELFGIRCGAAFPIRLENDIIGALNVAAAEPGFFREAEINLLLEVADDLSFALEVIRREEKHAAAESKMRYLAYYDSQTGMPSRALFEEKLAEACREASAGMVVVLIANLRRYHGVVQLLGAGAGLDIIRAMAARLEAALQAVPVARITESKFAVILRDPEGLDVAEELAWQMHRALAEAIQIDDQELFLDPFIGIAWHPQDGEPADVFKHALLAAEKAPYDANNRCRFFLPDMDEGSRRRINLDSALRRALERNEFVLHYQPQVDLASGRIVGAEALLRWQSRDYGLVAPQDFIPVLEENGLICEVGEWILHEACRRVRHWQEQGLPNFRIAVNLSARQFQDSDIRAVVRRVLETTRLEPKWLELELTESIVLLNADKVIRTMHELNGDGVSHALDDFGTGYSSLSYLQRLPVARIKIDRSFVINITSNPNDAAIVRAVVGMAHSLGLSVIAEGVETEGQLGFLRGIGCEEIQGYLFSRPLPADDFAALLREGRSIPPGSVEKSEQVVLLVDDDPNVLAALSRVLRRKGYRIHTASTAREGFDLLAIHQPGVVVCDQRMPGITGTEFLRRVKELHPDTMRIVLSGFTELKSVLDAVNQGEVYKFLTKPWDDEVLCDCIQDALQIYELHRENRELTRLLQARQ